MKTCDLSSGAAKLALALKQLGIKWEVTTETWDDATARRFHEEFIVRSEEHTSELQSHS